MFRSLLSRVGFSVEHGLQVVIEGRVTLYSPSGQYQIVAEKMTLQGQGNLQQAFEALKEKLKNEGLFEEARKRPLPRFPRRVAVITSLQGAVLRDVVEVSQRRWPQARLLAVSAKVQGLTVQTLFCRHWHVLRRTEKNLRLILSSWLEGGSFETFSI